jgi:hypothetical protein
MAMIENAIQKIQRSEIRDPTEVDVNLFHFDLGMIAEGSSPVPPSTLEEKDFHQLQARRSSSPER